MFSQLTCAHLVAEAAENVQDTNMSGETDGGCTRRVTTHVGASVSPLTNLISKPFDSPPGRMLPGSGNFEKNSQGKSTLECIIKVNRKAR